MNKTPTAQVAVLMAQLVYCYKIRHEIEEFEALAPNNWELVRIGFDAAHDGVFAAINGLVDNDAGDPSIRFLAQADKVFSA